MHITATGNYVTMYPESDRDLAYLKEMFPHLPKGPVSYIPEKSERELDEEYRMRMREIYPGIRLGPRMY